MGVVRMAWEIRSGKSPCLTFVGERKKKIPPHGHSSFIFLLLSFPPSFPLGRVWRRAQASVDWDGAGDGPCRHFPG